MTQISQMWNANEGSGIFLLPLWGFLEVCDAAEFPK